MPEDARPDPSQSERTNHSQSSTASERPGGHRARPECCGDWRCCEPDPYCWPAPPYWDPYCGPPRHHWPHFWSAPPMPDAGFFEAMMRFAAGAAGFRRRLWREMADAAHYAQRDWRHSWAPSPYDCDPCPPPWSSCEPCAPPRSHCDPCPPPHERCDEQDAPDAINLRELRATLEAGKEEKLKKMRAAFNEGEFLRLGEGVSRTPGQTEEGIGLRNVEGRSRHRRGDPRREARAGRRGDAPQEMVARSASGAPALAAGAPMTSALITLWAWRAGARNCLS